MTTPTRKWRITVLISGSGAFDPLLPQRVPLTPVEHPGSNLAALLSALPTTPADCSITHVLSSKSTAFGLTRAASHTPPIPTSVFSLVAYKRLHPAASNPREEYDLELAKRIRETKPDLVVLAGWMLILSEAFLLSLKRDWEEEEAGVDLDGSREGNEEVSGESTTSLPTPGPTPYLPPHTPAKGTPIPIINLHPALPNTFPGAHAILDAFNAFNSPPSPAERITKTGIMIHRVIPLLDAGEPVVVKEIEMNEGESLQVLEERIHRVEHGAIVEAVEKTVGMLRDGSWWK